MAKRNRKPEFTPVETHLTGRRFYFYQTRPYRDGGREGSEIMVTLCEFTLSSGMSHSGQDYKVVDVVGLIDSPSFWAQPVGGSIANFAIADYFAKGTFAWVDEDVARKMSKEAKDRIKRSLGIKA